MRSKLSVTLMLCLIVAGAAWAFNKPPVNAEPVSTVGIRSCCRPGQECCKGGWQRCCRRASNLTFAAATSSPATFTVGIRSCCRPGQECCKGGWQRCCRRASNPTRALS